MANGILELEPERITGTDAAAFAMTPQGAMLDQQLARQEMLQQQAAGGAPGPIGLAGGNPRMTPSGFMAAPVGGGGMPQGGFGGQQLGQIYGLLAQYADDPTQVGQSYAKSMQLQQQLAQRNSPMETWLRIYGNVNPHDYSPESIQKFHDHLVSTGEFKPMLLESRQQVTDKESQMIMDAVGEAQTREVTLGRMANLAQRFEQGGLQGMQSGAIASIDDWIANLVGGQDQYQALRTEYEQVKNKLVVGGLPPGVASDTDIAIAMRGWPPATADPFYQAAFLRGMMKIQAIEHAQFAHRAGYISRTTGVDGMLQDWDKNRDVLVQQSLNQFGGLYAPLRPDGTPMTPEEAARARYEGAGQMNPGLTPPPGQTQQPSRLPPGTDLNEVDDDALINYYLNQGGPT